MPSALRLALSVVLILQVSCSSATEATEAPLTVAAPEVAEPVQGLHELHNVFRLNQRIVSGDGPESPAALDELVGLGIKTIISVDGSMPLVDEAEARGLRYVHVPVTYARITPTQQLDIAKAIRDLPGPVYLHCHHGKHRGPAAAASAAVVLGMLTPEQAVGFMKQAGTSPSYSGLYACAAAASPVDGAVLDEHPSDFPSMAVPVGLTAAMVKVDVAFENLDEARAAGWAAPKTHPDLSPAAEAGQMADNLRFAGQSEGARELGAVFGEKLAASAKLAAALEQKLVAGALHAELEAAYAAVQTSCKGCHAEYRDSGR